MEKIIEQIKRQARLLGACDLLTGGETTLDELVRLFLTPQGMEFCLRNRFPSLPTFRQLKAAGADLTQYGIYVDEGNVRMRNPDRHIVLIGRTTATVSCDECQRYQVTLMHGAKGVVNAMRWAVVAVDGETRSGLMCNVSDNAIIL